MGKRNGKIRTSIRTIQSKSVRNESLDHRDLVKSYKFDPDMHNTILPAFFQNQQIPAMTKPQKVLVHYALLPKAFSKSVISSYGFWSELSKLFKPIEYLDFQILNKWFYRTGVERTQCKFILKKYTKYFTSSLRFDKHSLFSYCDRLGQVSKREDPRIDFENSITIQIQDALYCYSQRSGALSRYSQLDQPQIVVEELAVTFKIQLSALANLDN